MTNPPVELLSFIPTGAATKRGLADWASDYHYNVKNFGAVGNGATDDSAAIQDCFDAAFGTSLAPHGTNSQLNVPVYFPPGIYNCADLTLTQVQGGKIYGDGGVVLQFNGSNSGTHCIIRTNGFKDCKLVDIGFKGACPVALDLDWTGTPSDVGLSGNTLTQLGFDGPTIGLRIGNSGLEGYGNFMQFGGVNVDYALKIVSTAAHGNWLVGGGSSVNVAAIWAVGGSLVFANPNIATNPIDIQWDSTGTLVELGGRSESQGTHLKITNGRALIMGLVYNPGSGTNYIVDMASPASVVLDSTACDTTGNVKGTGGTLYLRGGAYFPGTTPFSGFSGQIREFITGGGAIPFTDLPPAAEGCEVNLSDATLAGSSTWGSNITAGSSTGHVLVRWNGTNWTLVGL